MKDQTILANSAIPTSSNRRKLLSTWKYVQEQTQNLRCKLSCPYCQKTFETYVKIEKHIGIHIMRWIRKLYNLSKNINNQEELIGCINTSPWTDFELPVHRHIGHYGKIEEHILLSKIGNNLVTIYFTVAKSMKNTWRV